MRDDGLQEVDSFDSATPMLEIVDLEVHYGAALALSGVSLQVTRGQMVALLGPNGAGKSTLGRAISGLIPVTRGDIRLNGTSVSSWPTHKRSQAGIAYIPEGRGVFPGLSVIDNLRMACRQAGGKSDRLAAIDAAFELFPALGARRPQRAGSLSGGEQKMLAMARALAVQPKVVVADEMSLGLAPLIVDGVFDGLSKACESGITVLLIEQFVHRALAMAHGCVILQRGSVAWSGAAADANERVMTTYLGEN
jgi:branched-chain amino acid transport system ATP-binding protein